MITNAQSGTTLEEIGDGIHRISTPVSPDRIPGGFTFNQILVVDDEPLLFHTGPRRMFPLVHEAVAKVVAVDRLRWISFSHFEADECGSMNEWLAVAPNASPLCGRIAANVQMQDVADRPPRALADGETISLGKHSVKWIDAPQVPHGWDCGFLFESTTRTLLCGDLFTQGGANVPAVTETDIVGPSESFRAQMDYYSHTKNARGILARLAACEPQLLACMHGSSFRGDGAKALNALADALDG